MKTFANALWLGLPILGALGLLSAPITYGFGADVFNVSLAVGGGAIGLLLLMSILKIWVEGARANSGILFGVFLGLSSAGGIAFVFNLMDMALVFTSAGVTGIIFTGIFASSGQRATSSSH
jgi:hypothetical protein